MPLYESVLIARQDLAAPQAEALGETFQALLEAQGGKVSKREYWGLRNLTYKIKKNRKGHYILMNVEASGPAIAELERNLRIHEDIIRYMTVRVDELEEGPSAIVRSRGQEDERPRGRGGFGGDRFGGDRPRGPRRDGPGREGGFGDRPRRDDAPSNQGEQA
ncbi:MAG TPA: 30S ribosomal protein S6 [Alphaproteobacteria bacterium]|nr:30S ribosomal protein S6 [Alphaproteobacteria bacterium]